MKKGTIILSKIAAHGDNPVYMNPLVRRNVEDIAGKSIRASKIYDGTEMATSTQQDIPNINNQHTINHSIFVEDIDSVSAVLKYAKEQSNGKVAILNFASFVEPGGGCLRGANAQEENLCYESNLFYVLDSFRDTFYKQNIEQIRTNKDLYYDRAIYSPKVTFAREIDYGGREVSYDEPLLNKAECDVITCAAPFTRYAMAIHKIPYTKCVDAMDKRIKFILDIAKDNEVDTLILGAFGCGVFGNDPIDVAKIFNKYLNNDAYSFKKVVFAIPNNGNSNYEKFKSIIG